MVDPETLELLDRLTGEGRVVAAMHFEGVRLIDNLPLPPPPSG